MLAIDWSFFWALSALALVASLIGTGITLNILKKKQILDLPNERSNHKTPTPRGGGIAIIGIIIPLWAYLDYKITSIDFTLPLLAPALALAILSFLDDIRSQRVIIRFGLQIVAVATSLTYLYQQHDGLIFQGLLPLPLDALLAGIAWVWFINLYNFMDGIDSITGSESICISVGIILLAAFTPFSTAPAYLAGILAASCLGFLWWNKHPAKIFMGDIGSIPLGFLLGYLLLQMAIEGYWVAALIFPAYYLADSSFTITKRLFQGKKIWEAHSEHFYQKAVRSGLAHSHVVTLIIILNQFLILLGLTSALKKEYFFHSLFLAVILTASLMGYFAFRHHKGKKDT